MKESVEIVKIKQCTGECGRFLEENESNFYKVKNKRRDGTILNSFVAQCKDCRVKKVKQYNFDNHENYKEYLKNWKIDNPEKRKQGNIEYRKKTVDRRMTYQQEWQKENKDKMTSYGKNKRKHDISLREWKACKEYFNYSCAYCGLLSEDHLYKYAGKLKKFDFHKEHVIHDGKNDLSNCLPSCRDCNSSKNVFELSDWYNSGNEVYDVGRMEKINLWLSEGYKKYIKLKFDIKDKK